MEGWLLIQSVQAAASVCGGVFILTRVWLLINRFAIVSTLMTMLVDCSWKKLYRFASDIRGGKQPARRCRQNLHINSSQRMLYLSFFGVDRRGDVCVGQPHT